MEKEFARPKLNLWAVFVVTVIASLLVNGAIALWPDDKPAVQAPAPAVATSPASNAKPTLTPMRILACCDSITVGEEGQRSWRDEMDAMLRERGIEPVWAVAAVAGTPCSMWGPLIKDLIRANRPDVLLATCGTNDDTSSAASRAALKAAHFQMITEAKARGVKAAVSSIQISRVSERPDLAWLPASERRANPILRANAGFYGDVAFADFEAIPATPANNPDGVHPTGPGAVAYAAEWIAAGARMGWWPA